MGINTTGVRRESSAGKEQVGRCSCWESDQVQTANGGRARWSMGPVRIRHSSHDFGWHGSPVILWISLQAKMASIEIWIP